MEMSKGVSLLRTAQSFLTGRTIFWDRCVTKLYRFLILAVFLTFSVCSFMETSIALKRVKQPCYKMAEPFVINLLHSPEHHPSSSTCGPDEMNFLQKGPRILPSLKIRNDQCVHTLCHMYSAAKWFRTILEKL